MNQEKERLAAKKFLPSQFASRYAWRTFLSGREFRLVQDRRSQVERLPDSQRPKAWFTNTSQSLDYQPKLSCDFRCPTLMTSSNLFVDFWKKSDRARPVHVLELLSMHALPLFLPSPDDWYQRTLLSCNFPDRALRKMAGNGMNMWVMGQFMVLVLGICEMAPRNRSLKRKCAMLSLSVSSSESDDEE